MPRREDWQSELDRLLVSGRDRPFEWGKWDCCLFVADAIVAVTGEDLAAGLRARYSSLREARWILRARYGSASIERSVAKLFSLAGVREVSPGFAHRGDPVIARSGRDFQIGVIGLNGLIVINYETKGLVSVPRSLATRAWCV
jgi:hypothetical protein